MRSNVAADWQSSAKNTVSIIRVFPDIFWQYAQSQADTEFHWPQSEIRYHFNNTLVLKYQLRLIVLSSNVSTSFHYNWTHYVQFHQVH